MAYDKLCKEYDAWHVDRAAGGNLSDPLELPWYRSAYRDIEKRAHGDVLEIGCGRGEFAIWLSQNRPDFNITAVDFSQEAINIAAGRALQQDAKVIIRQDNAEALSFPANSFDYIVSCECIEHVSNPILMAQEIARVLRPGGGFCVTTENYLNGMLIAWIKCWLTGERFNSGSGIQPYENFFFFWHVLNYLRDAGLRVDETESCHYQWLLLPRIDPARLCTEQFSTMILRNLAKPFGRHFSYFGGKPERA
jgi:2-polyprenyl-3-methyl-5-hydroxy-6-metoxy-1,4-benzoquinol methylase